MAKVVSHYTASAGGSSTMYTYEQPDDTSKALRIYTGDLINLPEDYSDRITNSMYPTLYPGGWIFWYYVHDIEPSYRTITDPCTAPESVEMDKGAGIIFITGGTGGDLNTWTGYAVSYRQRMISSTEWSDWSQETFTDSPVVGINVGSGMVRQYRVRTTGSAGSDYYSPYTVCPTLLIGNAPAGTPVVLTPVSGMETSSGCAAVKIECPPEPDGDAMTLQRMLNNGAWTTVANLGGNGGVVCDVLSVSDGDYNVRYRLADASGAMGSEDGISFSRKAHSWQREIVSGGIIANREISFAADLQEMLDCVNRLRTFYGLGVVSLPGEIGRLGDYQQQMTAMQAAVDECRTASGREAYGFASPSGWPHAQQINQLRQAMENT